MEKYNNLRSFPPATGSTSISESLQAVNDWMNKTVKRLPKTPFSAKASLELGKTLEDLERELALVENDDENEREQIKEAITVIYSELKEIFGKLFLIVYGHDVRHFLYIPHAGR